MLLLALAAGRGELKPPGPGNPKGRKGASVVVVVAPPPSIKTQSFRIQKKKNAPIPQHLAEHGLVELEQHARIGPPGDHEVATLGVRREERHFFRLPFRQSRAMQKNSSVDFLKASFFFFVFLFSSLSLCYSLTLFFLSSLSLRRELAKGGLRSLEPRAALSSSLASASNLCAPGSEESKGARGGRKRERKGSSRTILN